MKNALSIIILLICNSLYAQKHFTKNAVIQFDASGPLEKIQSKNGSAALVINIATGELQSSCLIKGFVFDKALMQEHFNENYLESERYPKATFKGMITNNAAINYNKDGTYQASVRGNMTMHGVTKSITVPATISIHQGKISVLSTYTVLCTDYNISIPSAVKGKVANQVKVTIKGTLDKMN